ncbi:unnamed protein product [Porites evermanni]|uniref:Mediator complex subunit 27 n=1 Tax=Porites evermanni TaxID=104178 RepID=A0ABN8SD67_9CNID|nr:unnamed protein product [Porites evermanni]
MADKVENIEECISTASNLRSTVNRVFQDLASDSNVASQSTSDATDLSAAGKGAKITQTLKKNLVRVHKVLSELDKASDALASSENRSQSLGNTGLLSLDPVEDRTALYDKLLETYDWHEKLTSGAQQALSCLKRHHPSAVQSSDGASAAKKAKVTLKSETLNALKEFKTLYPQLEFSCSTTNSWGVYVFEVVVPKTFKAIISMPPRMTEIDRLVIRGLQENPLLEKEELWSQSRYAVFRKVTDYATSALLHYYSATDPAAQLRGVWKWLSSFQGLFSIKCTACGTHLKEEEENVLLPPCWRTYEDLSPYHYQCRP